jgi:TRAP-type C4-dicarboxylate transport system permease small subunit
LPEGAQRRPRRTDYRATRFLIALEEGSVVFLMCALLAISAIQVVSRYVLNISVQWTEEVSQLAIVWLAFVGAALVSARSDHITMRVLGRLLRRRGRVMLSVLAYAVVIGSSVAIVALGFGPTRASMSIPLPATHWPAGLTYAGAMVGFVLIAVHSAINVIVVIRGGYDEARDDVDEGLI